MVVVEKGNTFGVRREILPDREKHLLTDYKKLLFMQVPRNWQRLSHSGLIVFFQSTMFLVFKLERANTIGTHLENVERSKALSLFPHSTKIALFYLSNLPLLHGQTFFPFSPANGD